METPKIPIYINIMIIMNPTSPQPNKAGSQVRIGEPNTVPSLPSPQARTGRSRLRPRSALSVLTLGRRWRRHSDHRHTRVTTGHPRTRRPPRATTDPTLQSNRRSSQPSERGRAAPEQIRRRARRVSTARRTDAPWTDRPLRLTTETDHSERTVGPPADLPAPLPAPLGAGTGDTAPPGATDLWRPPGGPTRQDWLRGGQVKVRPRQTPGHGGIRAGVHTPAEHAANWVRVCSAVMPCLPLSSEIWLWFDLTHLLVYRVREAVVSIWFVGLGSFGQQFVL